MKTFYGLLMVGSVMCASSVLVARADSMKLSGTVIGTELSVDYSTNQPSTIVNTVGDAFDGDYATFFASYERSFTWVGLDLGVPHVITRVGWAARNDGLGPGRMQLGVFQGANEPDFSDALPIYLIPAAGKVGEMMYADVSCSRGFRYVRYVGPHNARCNVAELEFYGTPGDGNDESLYQVTNLPTVVVNTPGMEWFHEDDKGYELNGSMIYVIADGRIDTGASGQVRGRGNASWQFPKKPFRIKFDKKQKVLGGPANAKKWTMINNYGDKTLMRNKIAFDISEKLGMPFTPACHFVDLVFNGEYQGSYQLCDQVEVKKGRVDITEMEPGDTEGEALTGGYLVEIDAYADQEAPDEWFNTTRGYSLPVTIKSPDPGVAAQYNYIRDRLSEFTYVMAQSYYADPEQGYRRLIDLDTFLKHFIVGELSGNTDTYWSVYMSLDRGADRFMVGPVWDFDIAFDNDSRTYPINNKSRYLYNDGSCAGDMKQLVSRIVRGDEAAKATLSYMWSYAREYQGLDADTFDALIDGYAADLDASQKLNFTRWPIMNEWVHQNPRIWGSYEAEVANVKSYLRKRFDKLDTLIGRVEVSGLENIGGDSTDVPAAVYNLQGMYVGDTTDGLAPSLYILKKGDNVKKIMIK